MLKSKIKKILYRYTGIENTIKEKDILNNNCLSLLSENSVCIYTLMKSGTTYTILFLSNYINFVYGDKKPVNFDSANKQFCIHGIETKILLPNIGELKKNNKISTLLPSYNLIFSTHQFIKNNIAKKIVCLQRNPLDILISRYYFHYLKRGIKLSHPRELIKTILPQIAWHISKQNEIYKKDKENVLIIAYEDLITDPKKTFIKLIDFLNLNFVQEGLDFAIENSSKKKVIEMEKERGEAIVKKDGIQFEGSFIRSGEIGEWKKYFNENDINLIKKELEKFNLSIP
ncbi:MAG: sulfotransferase domain-containing protein [Chitinophagaceae bacterium]